VSRDRYLSLEAALEHARRIAPSPAAEEVPVPDAAGRTLAEDVRAERDLPPAATSAMDGWAVRAADTPGALAAIGESVAGRPPDRALRPGQAVEISTGAILPEGADAVARREVVRIEGSTVRVEAPVVPGRDVRRQGEVIETGRVLHPAGHRVAPHEVGGLGAVGRATVLCARRIRVAILSNGEELVPLGAPADPAQVHDSSRHGLAAQTRAAGALVTASTMVGDDVERTVELVAALLDAGGDERPDVLITNGGIGRGPHDHVRAALERLGVEEVVSGVRASTIRPTVIGARGDQVVLGLPGNPVAAAVALHVLGRPVLGAPEDWWRRAPLTVDVASRPGRAELVRCLEGPDGLTPAADQTSHAVTSLAGATALAWVAEDVDGVEAGRPVPFSRMS
jgi:molybdopterin molybdotransferase